jgi:PKD repeat protein
VVKKAQKKSIVSSALITVFIVMMLIISGPAQAVSVIISGLQNDPYTRGSSINFTVSVNITDPDKYVPAANISLDVTGEVNLNRTFALNGTPIPDGNPVINITPVNTPQPDQFGYGYGYGVDSVGYGYHFGYGYGYGYGYGAGGGTLTYTYNVSINTASLPEGDYTAIARLNTENANKPAFVSAEATFEITTGPDPEIISRGNNKTGDASPSITVNQSETVRFNATADQIITEWEWNVDDDEQDNNFDNLSYRFDTIGIHEVKVEARNDNGTSDEITWTIDVKDIPPGDTTAPGSISGLHNISYAPDCINWTWADPTDADFSKVIVSIDGGSPVDVLEGTEFYNATGFAPDTEHTISTRTVDTSGNINSTWVNRTDRTAPTPPASTIQVTIEISPQTINLNSNGVITVSLLNNTPAGFDVADINVSTVRFADNAIALSSNIAANKLILKFNTKDTNIQCGDTQAILTGKIYTGEVIVGSASIVTGGCGGGGSSGGSSGGAA